MSKLDKKSIHLRCLVLRAMRAGRRGHYSSSASLIEILRIIYDIKAPDDKVILSKGHGVLALAAILVDKGIIPAEELDRFCKIDAMIGGHPSPDKMPGVEWHTGALGHGASIAIGQALAARIKKQKHRIFVIVGDGELNEGSCWEALLCMDKHKLNNITLVVDYNKLQSSGFVADVCPLDPLIDKFRAFGIGARECDGHNLEQLTYELSYQSSSRTNCVIAHTVKGKGIGFAENNPMYHYKGGLTDEQLNEMEQALGQTA